MPRFPGPRRVHRFLPLPGLRLPHDPPCTLVASHPVRVHAPFGFAPRAGLPGVPRLLRAPFKSRAGIPLSPFFDREGSRPARFPQALLPPGSQGPPNDLGQLRVFERGPGPLRSSRAPKDVEPRPVPISPGQPVLEDFAHGESAPQGATSFSRWSARMTSPLDIHHLSYLPKTSMADRWRR